MAKRKIAVIDAETDPFKYGRVPKPFCWGFFDGEIYKQFWGSSLLDCTLMMLDYLESRGDELLIYAHNGGKFDFLFFIERLLGKIRIVNGRILEAHLGRHTLRDSYAILPISLKKLGAGKKEIDYRLMEEDQRELHKAEILEYLEADCIALHKVVLAFIDKFGETLTVGSTAMKEFKKFHKFENLSASSDNFLRNYYFGGRCQCFEVGVIDTTVNVYDINSAYPDAMSKIRHPIGSDFHTGDAIGPDTIFVCWEGRNDNAVPTRTKTGLDFNVKEGLFWTSIHEFNTALEYGIIKPKKIKHTVDFDKWMTFDTFVDYFYTMRKFAQANGNHFDEIFYKLILNSAYGKFAQNPEHYTDSIILPYGEIPPDEYTMEYQHGAYAIWSKPALSHARYNVGTAASITGGVRAVLLKGLANTTRPLYCDTDSIFCNEMVGDLDSKRLGAWKHEAVGDQIAIAGKKLYALIDNTIKEKFDFDRQVWTRETLVKKASKGANLSAEAIFAIARGDTVETRNDAPTFKLGGKVTVAESGEVKRVAKADHTFIKRRIRRTGLQQEQTA